MTYQITPPVDSHHFQRDAQGPIGVLSQSGCGVSQTGVHSALCRFSGDLVVGVDARLAGLVAEPEHCQRDGVTQVVSSQL